jgi:hypothetical protein
MTLVRGARDVLTCLPKFLKPHPRVDVDVEKEYALC